MPPRRTGSSASAGTSGRSCSRREALDPDAPALHPLILAGVAFARPFGAVRLVGVELHDERVFARVEVGLVGAYPRVGLRRSELPQHFVLHAAAGQGLVRGLCELRGARAPRLLAANPRRSSRGTSPLAAA